MERCKVEKFSLHSVFNGALKGVKKALYRMPKEGGPVTVSGINVIGGFGSFIKALGEGLDVQVNFFKHDANSLLTAEFLLNSLLSECYFLKHEHECLQLIIDKVSKKHNGIKIVNLTHPACDELHSMVKQGSLPYALALSLSKRIGIRKQGDLLRRIKRAKLDVTLSIKDFLENGLDNLNNKLEECAVLPIKNEKQIASIEIISSRLLEIENRIKELDHLMMNAALEKAKLIYEIHHDNLFRECGCQTFREYYEVRLGMKKTHVYQLLKMFTYTPNLIEQISYKRLCYIHEWLERPNVELLNKQESLVTPVGDIVTIEALRDNTTNEMKRLLLPFMKDKHQKKFSQEVSGQLDYLSLVRRMFKKAKSMFSFLSEKEIDSLMTLLREGK